ncbi:MAG: hypothetical protein DRP87_19660 [Spirochaetes bacterium]|nr:MAG: hypothetical protein DRP87_19660 [Spirochaetota bacterium]
MAEEKREVSFELIESAGISEEDKKDILKQIEQVALDNRIAVTPELFKITPRKKGILLPLLINFLALLAIGAGVFFSYRYFTERKATLTLETMRYLSTEGRLLEKLKEETEEKLKEKDKEINKIQQDLAELDQQSRELKNTMEERIRQREEELRRKMEEELAAERARLEAIGTSRAEIEEQLRQLEEEKMAQFNQELAKFKEETEEALREKERELAQARELTRQILKKANSERQQLLEENRKREQELIAQFEKEREALESQTTEAERRLRELAALREREELVNDQIIGLYRSVIRKIETGDLAGAEDNLEKLKAFLNTQSIQSLPTIARRKEIELFIIDTLEKSIETETSRKDIETTSIIEAANLLIGARELVARADQAQSEGDRDKARRLYSQALQGIPSVSKALDSLKTIETEERMAAFRTLIEKARSESQEGDVESAVENYRQAAINAPRDNRELLLRALNGIEEELKRREAARIAEKEADIEELEGRIEDLRRDISQKESEIALLNETVENARKEKENLSAQNEQVIANLEEKIELLSEEVTEKKAQIDSLSGELAERKEEIDALRDDVAEKESRLSSLQAELAEKESSVSDLKTELSQKESAIEELETELSARIEELEGIKEQNETLLTFKESISDLNREYARVRVQIEELLQSENPQDFYAAKELLIGFLQRDSAEEVFPEIAEVIDRLNISIAGAEREEAKSIARETAINDVLRFIDYLTSLDPETIREAKIEVVNQTDEDEPFRKAVEEIQKLAVASAKASLAEEAKVTSRFLGTVSYVRGEEVVIEPLVNIPIGQGATIIIKRKSSAMADREETTIARGVVNNVSEGKILAKIDREGRTSSPLAMDMVYLQVKTE